MLAAPAYQVAPAVLAVCVYSVASTWAAALRRRWWVHAALAVLGFCLLFLGLAATSEAIAPRGFGEAAMLFLLPMEGFPVLLALSGIVRLVRGVREP
jgi:Na+/phosphate symporter